MTRELLKLFQAFAKEETQRSSGGSSSQGLNYAEGRSASAAQQRQVVDPNALREALSDLNPHAFSLGTHAPSPFHAHMLKPTAGQLLSCSSILEWQCCVVWVFNGRNV